jgi:hypothetical protein
MSNSSHETMFVPEVDTKMIACFRTVADIGSALVCSIPGWSAVLHCVCCTVVVLTRVIFP